MSYAQVLVGTDGSTTAARAVGAASRLAAAIGATLLVATAWQRQQSDPPPLSEEAHYPAGGGAAGAGSAWASTTTSDAAAIARSAGVRQVQQLQPVGRPAEALLELAGQHPDALLVVGTYGLDDRAERVVGNVPHTLTHHSPNDLLLTTGGGAATWTTVGLATDGSPTAARAVRCGLELAQALSAEPVLVTAARNDAMGRRTLAGVVQQVPDTRDLSGKVVTGGEVSSALGRAAADLDLLVIGNKGMSGPSRLLGSVANRVTHQIPTDLLLVNTTR